MPGKGRDPHPGGIPTQAFINTNTALLLPTHVSFLSPTFFQTDPNRSPRFHNSFLCDLPAFIPCVNRLQPSRNVFVSVETHPSVILDLRVLNVTDLKVKESSVNSRAHRAITRASLPLCFLSFPSFAKNDHVSPGVMLLYIFGLRLQYS